MAKLDPAEIAQALHVANQLVTAGVPLFVAGPCDPKCTQKGHKPGEGHNGTGYHLPYGWQTSKPTPDVVNRWRPGWALAALCGWTVDVLDIDPQNGGGESAQRLVTGGLWPVVYGVASTPSGGTHHLIQPLRVRKADPISPDYPGVDLQSGAADGEGRGFVFIAPTVKKSKVDGQPRAYTWTTTPDLAKLSEQAESDHSGQGVATLITTRRQPKKPATVAHATPAAASSDDRARVLGRVDELARELARAPEGQGNSEAARIGFMVGSYIGAGQLTLNEAIDHLHAAFAGWTWRDDASRQGIYGTLQRQLEEGANQPRPWGAPQPAISQREMLDDLVPGWDNRALVNELLGLDPNPPPEHPIMSTPRQLPGGPPSKYFKDSNLLVEDFAEAVMHEHPCALTAENKIAVYTNGVYHLDELALTGTITQLLGNRFSPRHESSVTRFIAGRLYQRRYHLPTPKSPLLNLANGMLNLLTGELQPHDPSHLSAIQLPVAWDPDAPCSTYEWWLRTVIPDQADDLEETVSAMLDPSRTPTRALFAYGPPRSGKSTFLRLAAALAGAANTSAVTLHHLVDDRFAAANLYGKILNNGSDLSSAHLEDISIFKMMTGEDLIHADRKYGRQFTFTNRALFAFSANTVPTVGDSSNAYIERIKPFAFRNTFVGHEDPTIEAKMVQELPGILRRWVAAWRRLQARGRRLDTPAEIRAEFEERSDRVRQWVADRCELTGGGSLPGALLPPSEVSSRRWLAKQFNAWAKEQGSPPMGERKIIDRLTSINGVVEVRSSFDKSRGLNIKVLVLDEAPNLLGG